MNEAEKIVPGGYMDFLNYLDTVTTEEALFSRLTYWFANQNSADDTRDRFDMVEDRAKELKLWNGLTLKMERWARDNKEEFARIGKDAFAALIGADYAAYRDNKPQQRKACKLQSYTARQLSEMTLQPTRYIVEGVLPMGMGLLVAKPKIGKSWMVLDLCLSVASSAPFLGFQTNQHGTLYLALEDGPSRMQGRILKVLDAGMKVTISFTPEERDQAWKVREVLLQLLGRCRTHTSQIGERCMIYLTLVH